MIDETLSNERTEEFDEYLWPLTDVAWPVNWTRLAEEHRLRHRLQEILAHVQEAHVAPRIRRLGITANPAAIAELTHRVIVGPPGGNFWELTLREPVPRALRDEWHTLATELRALCEARPPKSERSGNKR